MPEYPFDVVQPTSVGHRFTLSRLLAPWKNTMALKQGDQPLDQIRGVVVNHTVTGLQHNVVIPSVCSIFEYRGTAPAEITGFAGGRLGRMIIFRNNTSSYTRFRHDSASSVAGNRIDLGLGTGQYIGTHGAALFWYDGTYWQLELIEPGIPINSPFNATDFTGSGSLVWTVAASGVTHATFQQWGAILELQLVVQGSVSGAAGSTLWWAIPGGFSGSIASQHGPMMRVYDPTGGDTTGFAYCHTTQARWIQFYREGILNWNLGTNHIYMPRMRIAVV